MQSRAPTLPEEERGAFAGALPGTLLAAGYGLGIALLPLLAGPGKYFTDDMESQFVPALYAIGATLRAEGAVPLFTAQTWFGGSLAAEFQYGLFNPVLLLAYALLPGFATLTGAAAFLGAVFTALLSAGGFLLARALRIAPPLCHAAGFAIASNGFLYYWLATSWLPAFTSVAFMLWAMAFLVGAHRGAGGFLATGAGVYLTVTAGWPQTVLVLGLFVACHCAALALTGRWRDAAWPALAAALGVGAAAVALLPLFGMAEVAQRLSGVVAGGAMVPDLGDVLAVSQPFHFGYLMHFDGYSALPAPMFHAAWFVLPVACLLAWGRVPWRDPTLRTLLAFTALTLLATQGPSQFGPLRWPVRFLPYFQVGLVLLTLLMVARAGFAPLDAVRRRLLAGAVLVSTLLAWQSVPSPFFVALLSGLLLGLATAALLAVCATWWRSAASSPRGSA